MITLFDSGSIIRTLTVALSFIAIQLIMGNVVGPKVMGKGLDFRPLLVLLSLLSWEAVENIMFNR
jgi:AI-2 transport protein TqsA